MAVQRLSPVALGMALGLTWGLSVLIMGLIACYLTVGTAFVTVMGTLYVGYEASIIGSLIGGLIGFVDAFLVGLVVAWCYNLFAPKK